MGADEKHAATYHGGEYTPDTTRVRHAYVDHLDFSAQTFGLTSDEKFASDSFTRWLETVRAEAKAEAWDEGQLAGRNNEHHTNWDKPIQNPYKEQS